MTAKEFLESKGTDYTLNYPLSRKKEIEIWMDEYAKLYHESKVNKLFLGDVSNMLLAFALYLDKSALNGGCQTYKQEIKNFLASYNC